MAARLVLSQPSDADPALNAPRVIPVPGEVILRDSIVPRRPANPMHPTRFAPLESPYQWYDEGARFTGRRTLTMWDTSGDG
jgi:hypothetical protein